MQLTHLTEQGEAHMVDVGEKDKTRREAIAEARVRMKPETMKAIYYGGMEKGDVLAVARVAGIMAAKQTASLIPLCHPIPIDKAEIAIEQEGADLLRIRATLRAHHKTGVEMEALTAASMAALTVYDMCKAIDRGMVIEHICLIKKSGGKSGAFVREEEAYG